MQLYVAGETLQVVVLRCLEVDPGESLVTDLPLDLIFVRVVQTTGLESTAI